MKGLVSELCVGRFSRLARYFDQVYIDELYYLERQDMIDSVDNVDKLLTMVFFNEIIANRSEEQINDASSEKN